MPGTYRHFIYTVTKPATQQALLLSLQRLREPESLKVWPFIHGGARDPIHVTEGPTHLEPSLCLLEPELHRYLLHLKHSPIFALSCPGCFQKQLVLCFWPFFLPGLGSPPALTCHGAQTRRYSPGRCWRCGLHRMSKPSSGLRWHFYLTWKKNFPKTSHRLEVYG